MEESQIIALIKLLDDDDPGISSHVRNEIRKLGAKALPQLRLYLNELDKNTPLHDEVNGFIQFHHLDNLIYKLKDWQKHEAHNLLKGLWLINTYDQPDLNFKDINKRIEQLYYDVWLDFHLELNAVEQVRLLNNIFFSKLGFKANTQNFFAPENAFISHTLQERKSNFTNFMVLRYSLKLL